MKKLKRHAIDLYHAAWEATRPSSVRKLSREFPVERAYLVDGVVHFVIGYDEEDNILMSNEPPSDDNKWGKATMVEVPATKLRDCPYRVRERLY